MTKEFGGPNLPEFVDGETDASAELFNMINKSFDGRLHTIEELKVSWEEAVNLLTRQGLTRIDTVLGPAFEKLGKVLGLGFLVAESDTEITLAANGNRTFVLLDNEQTSLFTPSHMVTIQRKSDPTTWAIAQVAAPFNRQTRELQVLILSFAGSAGPFDDWEVGALAGSTIAQYAMLQTAIVTAQAVETARAQVASNAATVASDKAIVADDKAVALAARNKAADWATKGENQTVEPGLYSAMHWAIKAAASALAAALFDPANYWTKAQTYTRAEVEAQIAAAITALVGGAPGTLDAINELAAAIGNDPNFAVTIAAGLASKTAKLTWANTTGAVSAVAGTVYVCAPGTALTFPATPAAGDRIGVVTYDDVTANPVSINLNGQQFAGVSGPLAVTGNRAVVFVYQLAQWRPEP